MDWTSMYLWAGWLFAILLVFHATVFNYIALQVYKKNPYFKSVFFKLYLLHSLANYGVAGFKLLLDLGSPWTHGHVDREVALASYYFVQFLQCLSYTAIACNRFSAIVLPLRHASIWQTKLFWRVVVASIFVALICASLMVVNRTLLLWLYDITFEYAEAKAIRVLTRTTAAVYFLCFLVDAVLELWTFVAYQRMDFLGRKKHNENYRLLVSTLLGMILNTFLVSYYGMHGLYIPSNELTEFVFVIVIYLQALLGPVFLMLTSKSIRRGYMEFYGLRSSKTSQVPVFTIPKRTAT